MTSFAFEKDFQENLITHIRDCMGLAYRMQQTFLNDPSFIVRKEDNSPVTKADHAVQHAIEGFLAQACPNVLFVGEEKLDEVVAHYDAMPETFWLCDPIDGTRSYAKGENDYCINLALIENGVPTFGLIGAPTTGDIAITRHPNEAVFLGAANEVVIIKETQVEGTRLLIGSNRSRDADAFADRFGHKPESVTVRPSALKFHNLLRNDADYYIREGQVSEWDIAAGEALLRATGGHVMQFDGINPILYGRVKNRFLMEGLFASR